MNFEEAFKQLLAGKTIRKKDSTFLIQLSFSFEGHPTEHPTGILKKYEEEKRWSRCGFYLSDLLCEDWEVL
jgi:hypothetical protein